MQLSRSWRGDKMDFEVMFDGACYVFGISVLISVSAVCIVSAINSIKKLRAERRIEKMAEQMFMKNVKKALKEFDNK